jgi:tetratricopeptide (TPR) repeat protein
MLFRILMAASLVVAAQHAHTSESKGAGAGKELPAIGEYSFRIHTSVPRAQQFFNAGLAMIYGFNHDEAQRLFARAAELDPRSPMPHWGMALSLGSHINNEPEATRERKAWEAIARAQALVATAPPHEQRYVAALSARYSADSQADRKQLARDYAAAMATLHADYPDDPDAATLYAESLMNLNPWKYWGPDGRPAEKTLEFVTVLEDVLRRWPEHPGANHYYIHAVEASPHPERALAAANRLGKLVPAAGHLVHMPSHIHARLGDWGPAAKANAEAVAVDRAYLKGKPTDGLYPLMYYPHNIHFLLYAQGAAGQCTAAAATGRELVKQVSPGLEAMPMLQGFVAYVYQLSVWCPAVALPAAPLEKHALAKVAYHYAHGTRAGWAKNVAAARVDLLALRAAAARVAPDTIYEPGYTAAYLQVAASSLEARIADADGDLAAAAGHWRIAVDAQDKLRYDEPPIWYYQVRQSLGAALLRAGKLREAEAVLRESLNKQPRDGRVLFLLWKTLAAQNREREATLVEAQFRAAWKGVGVPRVEEL